MCGGEGGGCYCAFKTGFDSSSGDESKAHLSIQYSTPVSLLARVEEQECGPQPATCFWMRTPDRDTLLHSYAILGTPHSPPACTEPKKPYTPYLQVLH